MSQNKISEIDSMNQKKRFDSGIYKKAKEYVFMAERANQSFLFLYGGGDGWYKMAGKSLLMYKYYICPRCDTKPTVRPDEDYSKPIFPSGYIAFSGIDSLLRRVGKAKILSGKPKENDGIVRIPLSMKFTDKQLEEYDKELKHELERMYAIIKPSITVMPKLHMDFREILKRTYDVYNHMSASNRRVSGDELLDLAKRIENTYLAMNQGSVSESEGWKIIENSLCAMQIELITATELNILDCKVSAYIGERLIRSKRKVKALTS